MANRTVGPFDVPDPDDLREMTRAVNEVNEMTRAVNQDREIYDAIHQDREMYRQIKEAGELYRPMVESIAAAIPESVASIPRNVAATRSEALLERTLDRNQKALIRIAKHQLELASEARRQLDLLRSAGLL